jgi:predicted ABC-type ATPase
LTEAFRVQTFVNADAIAAGLSPFRPEQAAIEAGRVILGRIEEVIWRTMEGE